jgi:4-diphosphocytidyl-2-C-methyl-D-erythritol kinase
LFNLNLSNDELRRLASELGSDCPFFVEDMPQIASGRGEILTPIDINLKGFYLKIVNPGIHVGTAEAYAKVKYDVNDESIKKLIRKPIGDWKDNLTNSFEHSVFPSYPELKEIKNGLYSEGAVYASMTGSGSTMFGIFTKKPKITHPLLYERIVEL